MSRRSSKRGLLERMATPSRLRQPGDDDGEESAYPLCPYQLPDFMERECPPIAWIIGGLVQANSLTLIVSPPNAGKTLLAFDYAMQAAASGRRVLIVEEEGGMRGCQERLRRSAFAAGLSKVQMGLVYVAWNTRLNLMDVKDVNFLIAYCVDQKIEVVILDSLSALSHGIDENDSIEMATLAEMLHGLKASTAAAVIALHHTTKDTWKPGQTPTLASARGHGALAARADSILALVPIESKAGTVCLELHSIKQRDAEKCAPRTLQIMMSGPSATISSMQYDRAIPPTQAARRLSDMMKDVLGIIPEGDSVAVSCNAVVTKLGKHKPTVLAAIRELLFAGKLRQLGDGRIYRMKAPVLLPNDSGRYNRFNRPGESFE